MKCRKRNPNLKVLIRNLRKKSYENNAPLWRDIAKRLEKPNRNWACVNVGKIGMCAKKKETIIVPGKLLGDGTIDKPVTIAAYTFSKSAKEKISSAGGKTITIMELVEQKPRGSGVRIIG